MGGKSVVTYPPKRLFCHLMLTWEQKECQIVACNRCLCPIKIHGVRFCKRLKSELLKHREVSRPSSNEVCPHCESGGIQTRDCMQAEAVSKSVGILREMANGPTGRARGRIILPCGTGKSRIALRIIEKLTEVERFRRCCALHCARCTTTARISCQLAETYSGDCYLF